jgi:TonB-dependent starch-binding outer membrane protein SusC
MRRIFTLMLMMLLCGQVWAQKVVTGKVTDESGNPLQGVSVQVKGGRAITTTDGQGNFSIDAGTTGKILVFTSVNTQPTEVSIGGGNEISVTLKSKEAELDEVVVTGYQTVRKKDVSAAISKISGEEIENLPFQNVAQAIQGRAAGVAVAAANGIPGGSMSVIIRGVGSINAGSTPLYVVDGVQLNTGLGSINTQNNPLNFLNPDDIESIEILKDAAAASIYGARAGNGVILVTTKKGKSGKPKFTFNTFYGQSKPLLVLNSLNTSDWYQARYEALANANPSATPDAIRNTVLSNLGLPANTDVTKLDSLPSYDWQREAFGTGTLSNIELSMQGGGQNLNYYLSGSYAYQSAFIAPTNFERGNLLSKVNYKMSDKVSIENSISLSTTYQLAPYSTGNTGFGNPAYAAAMILPINPIYNPDGTYFGLPGSNQNMVGTFNHNVLAVGDYANYNSRTNQLVGSLALNYKPIAELTLRGFVGLDYRQVKDQRYQDPRLNDAFAVNGRLSNQVDFNTNFITNGTAAYRKVFNGKHSVNGLLGIEYRKDQNEWFQADGQGFASYQLQYLSSSSLPSGVSGSWSANATFSQFAKLGYSFNSKYIFNFTLRRDASSRFGTNNQVGYFPSAQVAWNVKDESFMQGADFLSDLKLRYSYGETGNDAIGNFAFRQLYGAGRIYGNASSINPSQLGNPDLKWETRKEHNIGIDAGFFNNRIQFTADAYRRLNTDLLLSRSLYQTSGFSSITQNLGSVLNKGLELMLTVKPLDGKFKWMSSFNIAFQKNEVKELYDGITMLPGDNSIQVGYPLGSFFTTPYAGVNPATGRAMWYDINDNITYNPVAADRRMMGNIYPTHFGGWTNTFSYKGFTLDFFFQYEYGRVRNDGQLTQYMRMGGATVNTWQDGFDQRWQKPGDITWVPRPFNGMAEFNSVGWAGGTRYQYKTDYIRLKNLTFSYDFSPSVARKLRLENVRLYVQGVNLWTYTEWLGYDPEFTGDNFGIIPQSKNITGGIQVKF